MHARGLESHHGGTYFVSSFSSCAVFDIESEWGCILDRFGVLSGRSIVVCSGHRSIPSGQEPPELMGRGTP